MASTVAPPVAAPAVPHVGRWVGLDRLRGLAILCMVVDHVTLVFGGPDILRLTVGRVAMPLFFLVAGVLVASPRPKWLLALGLGFALPYVVPWIDSPNVLVLYVVGAVCIVVVTRLGVPSYWLALPALVAAANGWVLLPGYHFDPLAAVALMGVGHWCLPTRAGGRLPALLGPVGRFPLTVYIGHLLILQAVIHFGGVASPAVWLGA